MEFQIVFQASEEDIAVSVPQLPGCHSQGLTERQALQNILQAIREYCSVADELNKTNPNVSE